MKSPRSKKGMIGPPGLDTMVIAHQDGDLLYKLKRGGYSIADNAISISVETESAKEDQFPDCALIALEGHPITAPLQGGDVFECSGGMLDNPEDGSARAHGYFTFHVEEISMRWTVETIEDKTVVFSLEATHDDVNYYNDQAKVTPTRGLFRLAQKPLSELWIPA